MDVQEIIRRLPKAPAGVEKWIREEVVDHTYMIFSRKENKAVCTRCGRKWVLSRGEAPEHNVKTYCPNCEMPAVWKEQRYGRKTLTEYTRVMTLTHHGPVVYATLWEIIVDFKPFGKPDLYKWLSAVYRFTEKEQEYYKHVPEGYFYGERWEKRKRITCPAQPSLHGRSRYTDGGIYPKNLRQVFEKSCLKNYYIDEIEEEDEYFLIRYIDQSLKYPAIELLRKAGFTKLTWNALSPNGRGALNIRGKNLEQITRLPRRWWRKARDMDLNSAELAIFQKMTEQEKRETTKEEIRQLDDAGWYAEEIEKYTTMIKAARYAVQQEEGLYIYRDYLRMANQNGLDMSRKSVLFPKDLCAAHDEMLKKIHWKQNKEREERWMQIKEKIARIFPEYEQNGLLIRPVHSLDELDKESRVMKHCVRTYADRVANGKTVIFFVRKKEEPEEPFYTLELNEKTKKIVQCRGKKNCAMTPEVEEFVESWEKQLQRKVG